MGDIVVCGSEWCSGTWGRFPKKQRGKVCVCVCLSSNRFLGSLDCRSLSQLLIISTANTQTTDDCRNVELGGFVRDVWWVDYEAAMVSMVDCREGGGLSRLELLVRSITPAKCIRQSVALRQWAREGVLSPKCYSSFSKTSAEHHEIDIQPLKYFLSNNLRSQGVLFHQFTWVILAQNRIRW